VERTQEQKEGRQDRTSGRTRKTAYEVTEKDKKVLRGGKAKKREKESLEEHDDREEGNQRTEEGRPITKHICTKKKMVAYPKVKILFLSAICEHSTANPSR